MRINRKLIKEKKPSGHLNLVPARVSTPAPSPQVHVSAPAPSPQVHVDAPVPSPPIHVTITKEIPIATPEQLATRKYVYPDIPKDIIKILPEMRNIPWQLRPNRGGGRGIEIPYIQRKFEGIKNKKIADFGCLDGHKPTTSQYVTDPNNEFYYFDNEDVSIQNYFKRDFTKDDIFNENFFDYGICVSVIEHVGLNKYNNILNDDGDILALKNILKTIKKDGVLYVTIPVSEKFYTPLYWIRSYSVKQIESWQKVLNCSINIDTFQYIKDSWYSCPKEKIIGSYHYTGNQVAGTPIMEYDIVAIACLEIRKNG